MNEALVRRVKSSLNGQHYIMNDSWLTDCIEYYLTDNPNAPQKEITTFVMNQWVLYDLREINNEQGCLPKNLAKQKCTTLTGKYILQMDKIYDISQSKYKQLEKIRNVSSINVEVTERENVQEQFQNFDPKPKRMLQLFLTDGIQDILAIEYKPIRFLKDDLIPGLKVMIKGPVICRKGVILLEETNFAEIGGEVDSLLIINAVENVFARALNLEENPDPYNDKQTQNNQTKDTQRTIQEDEDFDIDSEVLEQIDKQVEQQSSISSKNSHASTVRNPPNQVSATISTPNTCQRQNSITSDKTQSSSKTLVRNQQSSSSTTANQNKTPQQKNNSSKEKIINFEDDGDSFLEMVDDKAFENVPTSKPAFKIPQLPTPLFKKSTPLPSATLNSNIDDFPTDDEIYDLTGDSPPSSIKSKSQNKSSSFSKTSCNLTVPSNKKDSKMNYTNTTSRNISIPTPSGSRKNENSLEKTSTTSNKYSIPDDDFDLDDVNMETEDFKDYFSKSDEEKGKKSSQSSINSWKLKNTNMDTEYSSYESSSVIHKIESEFEEPYDIEFEDAEDRNFKSSNNQRKDNTSSEKSKTKSDQSKNRMQSDQSEQLGVKRSGDVLPNLEEVPQKVRCLQTTPKSNKPNERKITDFLSSPKKPTCTFTNKKSPLLKEDGIKCFELLKDALKVPIKDDPIRIVIRGRVVKVIKLNLLKNENGSYFHLEGVVTDGTANLDVVFSSEVLEKVIGYSPQQFSQKRKLSKADPAIKEQLREDLKKAQQILTVMDELMEIELKKNNKPLIINTVKLTEKQKKSMEDRLKLLNR